MASVQFRNSDDVLTAYANSKCPAWSLWQGRQMLFKYVGSTEAEGAAALSEVLTMIDNGSNAIYTLRVYEETPAGKVKDNTPYDGSFNFRLNEEQYERGQHNYKENKDLNARIALLEAQLQAKEAEEEEEEDETEKALGKIGALINNPVVMQLASMIFGAKGGTMLTAAAAALPGKSLGNVPQATTATDQETKINQALIILRDKDSKIGDHLEKLAAIANSSPANFEYLLNLLEQVQI